MAIRDELIREFEKEEEFTNQDARNLGFRPGSVSSALSRGVKAKQFTRIERGLYRVDIVWYEKMIGTIHSSKPHKKIRFLVVTHETNDINRKQFLIDFVDEKRYGYSEATGTWKGYQQRISENEDPEYPEAEIIET